MGTNYYAVKNKPSIETPIHIGKSSYGWLFSFQTQHDSWREVPVVWTTYDEVVDWLNKHVEEKKEYVIINEYDEIISFNDFLDMIEANYHDENNLNNPDNFQYCRKDPNGYRFCDGEFS